MRRKFLALALAGAAAGALCGTGAAAHGIGNSAGTAVHAGNFHRHGPVLWPFGFRGPHLRFVPGRGVRHADVGALGDDASGDYGAMSVDDEGGNPGDMHFRTEEPFGPWDIGMRPPPGDDVSGAPENAGDPSWDDAPQDW